MLHLIGYQRRGDSYVFAPTDSHLPREVLEKVRAILAQRLQEVPSQEAPTVTENHRMLYLFGIVLLMFYSCELGAAITTCESAFPSSF